MGRAEWIISREDRDSLMYAERAVKKIPGIVATDSKGGFDAVTLQEGPYLGLTNVRAAIQAFQLKQSLALAGTNVIWLAGDWLLGDAFTKRSPECRKSLIQFLQQGVWMLKYRPERPEHVGWMQFQEFELLIERMAEITL